eukprot:513350-Hanusia_phi.AAC.1
MVRSSDSFRILPTCPVPRSRRTTRGFELPATLSVFLVPPQPTTFTSLPRALELQGTSDISHPHFPHV